MSEKRVLDFLNSIHDPLARQITVRRGYKWADVRPGDIVDLADNGKLTGARARIEEIRIMFFDHLAPIDIMDEHDPDCRTTDGLTAAMKRAYPEFTTKDTVVVLQYCMERSK